MLKLELEELTKLNNVRIILEGKEYKDHDRLTTIESGKTLYLSKRILGGDPFTDIFKIITGVFDFIINIFNGVIFIVKAVFCGILHLQNLWFCIFFDCLFLFFFIIYIFFYVVFTVMDALFSVDFFVPNLEYIWNYDVEGFIRKNFPQFNSLLDKIFSCFRC